MLIKEVKHIQMICLLAFSSAKNISLHLLEAISKIPIKNSFFFRLSFSNEYPDTVVNNSKFFFFFFFKWALTVWIEITYSFDSWLSVFELSKLSNQDLPSWKIHITIFHFCLVLYYANLSKYIMHELVYKKLAFTLNKIRQK